MRLNILKPFGKEAISLKRSALLIIIFSLMALSHRAEAGELAMLYSNDTRGVIDACPT